MKILIWVHKNDVLANKILTYHFTRPIIDRHDQYLQIEITQDEFARLEDGQKSLTYPEFRDKHYTKEAMIHERNPDTGEIRSRVIENDEPRDKEWYKDQYNRNRNHKDQKK